MRGKSERGQAGTPALPRLFLRPVRLRAVCGGESRVTIHPTIRGTAIALLGIVGAAALAVHHYEAQIAELVATLGAAQTEALGIDWTKVRTSRDLSALVPSLREQLERARKAGTKPVLAVTVRSADTEYHLPDWSPCNPSPAHGGPVDAGPVSTSSPAPLLVSAEAQGALTGLADVRSDLAIDPAVAEAYRSSVAPSYRLDAFVGLSLGLDGLGVVGQVSGGRRRVGWFAGVDYRLADPARSRVSGGGRFTLKR